MSDPKLSKETATEQLEILLDYYDIDDSDFIDDETGEVSPAVASIKRKLIKALSKGRLELEFDDNGQFTGYVFQHLEGTYKKLESPVKYKKLGGAAKVATKEAGENNKYGKVYALMGSLCGFGSAAMIKLDGPDSLAMENLGLLFLLA